MFPFWSLSLAYIKELFQLQLRATAVTLRNINSDLICLASTSLSYLCFQNNFFNKTETNSATT